MEDELRDAFYKLEERLNDQIAKNRETLSQEIRVRKDELERDLKQELDTRWEGFTAVKSSELSDFQKESGAAVETHLQEHWEAFDEAKSTEISEITEEAKKSAEEQVKSWFIKWIGSGAVISLLTAGFVYIEFVLDPFVTSAVTEEFGDPTDPGGYACMEAVGNLEQEASIIEFDTNERAAWVENALHAAVCEMAVGIETGADQLFTQRFAEVQQDINDQVRLLHLLAVARSPDTLEERSIQADVRAELERLRGVLYDANTVGSDIQHVAINSVLTELVMAYSTIGELDAATEMFMVLHSEAPWFQIDNDARLAWAVFNSLSARSLVSRPGVEGWVMVDNRAEEPRRHDPLERNFQFPGQPEAEASFEVLIAMRALSQEVTETGEASSEAQLQQFDALLEVLGDTESHEFEVVDSIHASLEKLRSGAGMFDEDHVQARMDVIHCALESVILSAPGSDDKQPGSRDDDRCRMFRADSENAADRNPGFVPEADLDEVLELAPAPPENIDPDAPVAELIEAAEPTE